MRSSPKVYRAAMTVPLSDLALMTNHEQRRQLFTRMVQSLSYDLCDMFIEDNIDPYFTPMDFRIRGPLPVVDIDRQPARAKVQWTVEIRPL